MSTLTSNPVRNKKLNPAQLGAFGLFHGVTLYLLFQVSWAWPWLLLAFLMHSLRFIGVTVVLHRYFSHKAFSTSRFFQFVLALFGSLTLIRGPIRFAAAHRHHHRHSDTALDAHSPNDGFWWSYVGWLMSQEFVSLGKTGAKDLRKYKELVLLDRFYWLPALLLASVFYATLGTEGVVWGVLVSTLSTWHLAFFVTSVFHVWGHKEWETDDESRNHAFLAWLTLGEGWHNNHHYDMHSAQLGRGLKQVDMGFWVIWVLEKLRLIWNVKRFGSHSRAQIPD